MARFRRNDEPDSPTDMKGSSWGGVLKRTVKEFRDDNLTDWAAALTYYGVLSIFPALIVLVSILGLIGESATQPLIDNLGSVAPGPAQEIFTSAIENLQGTTGAAGVLFIVGLAAASGLRPATSAPSCARRTRSTTLRKAVRCGRRFLCESVPTLLLMVLTAISAVAVVLSGGLAEQVGNVIGVGDTAVTVWNIAKWPVLILFVSFMFSSSTGPRRTSSSRASVDLAGRRARGDLWMITSVAFAFYVANFGSYNKTYGALAGPIVFLVWLWISNIIDPAGRRVQRRARARRELSRPACVPRTRSRSRNRATIRRHLRIADDDQRLRHQQADAAALTRLRDVQPLERRMIADVVRRVAVRHLPQQLAAIEIDRRQARRTAASRSAVLATFEPAAGAAAAPAPRARCGRRRRLGQESSLLLRRRAANRRRSSRPARTPRRTADRRRPSRTGCRRILRRRRRASSARRRRCAAGAKTMCVSGS